MGFIWNFETPQLIDLKQVLTVLFLLMSYYGSYSQILKSYNPNADFNKLVFNEEFIQKNKIKKITAEKSIKKDGDIIRSDGSKELFQFDKYGQLASYGLINAPNFQDTVYQLFTFANQYLIGELLINNSGETAELFEYDDKGRVTGKEKIKNYIDESGTKKTTAISDERIAYKEESDTSWVATYFNTNEKPYKEIQETHNSMGLLVSLKERYFIGNRVLNTYYWYNEMAYLSRISLAKNNPENTVFSYDYLGNLIRIEHRKGGKLQYIREFFYSEKTGMLRSSFMRYEESGLIKIEKYNLEYY